MTREPYRTLEGYPRKAYSIRLKEELLNEMREMAKKLKTSAAIYVESAITEKLERDRKKKRLQ